MSDTVIRVENLSKKYVLSHQQEGRKYKALRDVMADGAKAVGKKLLKPSKMLANPNREEFWALKDVSFEIKQGERVGIIGRNGAGKSTLLKVLSRIVEPTSGRIGIRGRVASLLEVGTGFHPELTGRENIYLNGAILGMGRAEIARKFDEIVAFAEVEKFLDTPVKRYSSGMYVRLAFAVAAHLEPEILIIDEVLAVGDSQFQKKCLGKMEEVGKEGRTVIFVSHSMATVTSLCQRAIWLVKGQAWQDSDAESVTSKYLTYGAELSGDIVLTDKPQPDQRFKFNRVSLINSSEETTGVFDVREPIKVHIEYQVMQQCSDLEISFQVQNSFGVLIFTVNRSSSLASEVNPGCYMSEIEIPSLLLVPGSYSIDIAAHIPMVEFLSRFQSLMSFEIEETGSPMARYAGASSYGVVFVDIAWKEKRFAEVK